jgi:hypothetical protein
MRRFGEVSIGGWHAPEEEKPPPHFFLSGASEKIFSWASEDCRVEESFATGRQLPEHAL